VREADNLTTFTCRMSRKSGSLNLLELSGPVTARGFSLVNVSVKSEQSKIYRLDLDEEVMCGNTRYLFGSYVLNSCLFKQD
jgi:hypothetical protein